MAFPSASRMDLAAIVEDERYDYCLTQISVRSLTDLRLSDKRCVDLVTAFVNKLDLEVSSSIQHNQTLGIFEQAEATDNDVRRGPILEQLNSQEVHRYARLS